MFNVVPETEYALRVKRSLEILLVVLKEPIKQDGRDDNMGDPSSGRCSSCFCKNPFESVETHLGPDSWSRHLDQDPRSLTPW